MRDKTQRDKPWIFRTYAGHSTAADSNALYRKNLAKGQTGLSVAFDLPTQTGYDSDHVLARGEVGKVGVPVCHLGDMRALFDGIPLGTMNTSMTINATAAWLMALYIAVADEQGAPRASLTGTIQNDIIKEYLSRGTYVFPPAPSMRLIKDVAIFTTTELPKWNPMNICSYHLQEAGATPVQELAFALATAVAVLDTVKNSGEVSEEKFGEVVGRISFFVNAGMRFITEMCKMRAFTELWDEITRRSLRHHRCQTAAVPLRRAGELAWPHGTATGKQRHPHSARDAGGHIVQERARARRAIAGLERGARPAAAVGPAVVAAHAADPGLRDRPARLRRHFRRLGGNRAQGRRAQGRGQGRTQAHRRDGRRGGRGRVRLHEAAAGRIQHRAAGSDRARRADRGRRQQISRDRALAAHRRHRLDHDGVGRRRARSARTAESLARGARQARRRRRARRIKARGDDGRQYHAGLDRLRQSRRHHRRMGLDAARGFRRIPRADRGRPRHAQRRRRARRHPRRRRPRFEEARPPPDLPGRQARARRPFATAPSRSRCARAMPACRWSTRASA